MQREVESSRLAVRRSGRSHQDAKTGQFGQGAQRFPDGGLDHGTIRASKRDIPPGRRHPVQPGHDHYRVHGERFAGHVFEGECYDQLHTEGEWRRWKSYKKKKQPKGRDAFFR